MRPRTQLFLLLIFKENAMFWYLFAFAVACLIGLGYLVLKLPFFIKELARMDILFTTVNEGTAKAVMKGGSFDFFIMSFAGYHLNVPGKPGYKTEYARKPSVIERIPDWEVLYHGEENPYGFTKHDDKEYDVRHSNFLIDAFLKHFGIYWIGWPWSHSIHVYEFEWNEIYTDSNGTDQILPRDEPTDFIFVADFTYAVKTVGAETQDRLSTDELTMVTIAVRNPYRALFSGEDWMRRITAAINGHVRGFVGSADYQELIGNKKRQPGASDDYWYKNFSQPIIGLTDFLPGETKKSKPPYGLKGRYGVEIRTADLQTMDLSGDGKGLEQKATTTAYVAEQDAKATRIAGKAAADVIQLTGEAEAAALETRLKVINQYGPDALALAQFDAMQEASKGAGNTVIWANNPLIAAAAGNPGLVLPHSLVKKGGAT